MDNTLKVYTFNYLVPPDNEEDIIEIPAYSYEQALIKGNFKDSQVLNYECSVKRCAKG